MLSEVDKWSQKYTLYRKVSVLFIGLLIASVLFFFLSLSSVLISMICLVISFIAVFGIRFSLSKMDEFKALYVNTVPMINPEKDFKEGKEIQELDGVEVLFSTDTTEEILEAIEILSQEQTEEVIVGLEDARFEQQLINEVENLTDLVNGIEMQLEAEAIEGSSEKIEAIEDSSELTESIEVIEETSELTESIEVIEETSELTEAAEVIEETSELTEVAEVIEETSELTEVAEVIEETSELTEAAIMVEELNESTKEVNVSMQPEPSEKEDSKEQVTLSREEQVFETIKLILRQNHCDIEPVSCKTVGNYLTIYVKNRVMIRVKLNGRKQYVLTYLTESEVLALGLAYESPSKSELYESRVEFTSIAVLAMIEQAIVSMYRRVAK